MGCLCYGNKLRSTDCRKFPLNYAYLLTFFELLIYKGCEDYLKVKKRVCFACVVVVYHVIIVAIGHGMFVLL